MAAAVVDGQEDGVERTKCHQQEHRQCRKVAAPKWVALETGIDVSVQVVLHLSY